MTASVATRAWRGVIEEYRSRLPVTAETPVITLREGGTPLLPAPVLSARTDCDVYLKVEGLNPTGSFKDRGMTVALSMAAGAGAKAVICASTGNTSASAAAYAAR
jgi:threonine synthase